MVQIGDWIYLLVELVLVALFFLACFCSACCLRREARANVQAHPSPRAPVAAASAPPWPQRSEERLRAPVVLAHFPYAARARAASEPPPVCTICLDELRQGQLCSEVPACRHIFHESCIRAWAKKKNSCPLCRVRVVMPGTANGVAAADDMV